MWWSRGSLPLGPVPGLVLLAGRPPVLLLPSWVQVKPAIPLAHISLCHDQRSVANPGCSSRIPDPNFFIPDPGSKRFRIKKLFLSSWNYDPGCSSRIPELDSMIQHCIKCRFSDYNVSKNVAIEHQRNKLTRGTTELVQHFRLSYRRKSAAWHKFDMVWLYRSPIPMGRRGILLVQLISTCLRCA